jgi:hypothetical protein
VLANLIIISSRRLQNLFFFVFFCRRIFCFLPLTLLVSTALKPKNSDFAIPSGTELVRYYPGLGASASNGQLLPDVFSRGPLFAAAAQPAAEAAMASASAHADSSRPIGVPLARVAPIVHERPALSPLLPHTHTATTASDRRHASRNIVVSAVAQSIVLDCGVPDEPLSHQCPCVPYRRSALTRDTYQSLSDPPELIQPPPPSSPLTIPLPVPIRRARAVSTSKLAITKPKPHCSLRRAPAVITVRPTSCHPHNVPLIVLVHIVCVSFNILASETQLYLQRRLSHQHTRRRASL